MHITQEKTSQIAKTMQGNKQWEGKKTKINYEKETSLRKKNSNVRSNYEPQRLIHDVNKFINIEKDNHSNQKTQGLMLCLPLCNLRI